MAWRGARPPLFGLLLGVSVAASLCWRSGARAAPCPGEEERARAASGRIERQWPLRGSGPDADFVRALGARLGAVSGDPSRRWTFVLVRDARPNAFSVGNGRIYLTEGAIRACETEAELAALIAHEMGHELAGHFCAAPSGGDGGVGGLQQRIEPKLEREADYASLRVLAAAGYDPKAALAIATRIGREGDGQRRESWDRERLDQLARLVAEAPAGGRSDTPEFRRLRRQLDAGRQQGQ